MTRFSIFIYLLYNFCFYTSLNDILYEYIIMSQSETVTDNTASILARRSTFTQHDRAHYHLPVVIRDSGSPILSSTTTLTIRVCACQPTGHCLSGGVEVSLDVSMQILLGFSVCLITLAGEPLWEMLIQSDYF